MSEVTTFTLDPGERLRWRYAQAPVAAFVMVTGSASGMVRYALLDSDERELLAGSPATGTREFGGGVPMRPVLPFFVEFENTGDKPVIGSFRVWSDNRGHARLGGVTPGCAPGCMLALLAPCAIGAVTALVQVLL